MGCNSIQSNVLLVNGYLELRQNEDQTPARHKERASDTPAGERLKTQQVDLAHAGHWTVRPSIIPIHHVPIRLNPSLSRQSSTPSLLFPSGRRRLHHLFAQISTSSSCLFGSFTPFTVDNTRSLIRSNLSPSLKQPSPTHRIHLLLSVIANCLTNVHYKVHTTEFTSIIYSIERLISNELKSAKSLTIAPAAHDPRFSRARYLTERVSRYPPVNRTTAALNHIQHPLVIYHGRARRGGSAALSTEESRGRRKDVQSSQLCAACSPHYGRAFVLEANTGSRFRGYL